MGQRNMLYTGPMIETEHGHIHPETCLVSYGGIPTFLQPSGSFNPQHLPENHAPSPHAITQYNNVFMTPTGARVFPVAINHGMQDPLPFSFNGSFENGQFIDEFKIKNGEGFAGNVRYFYPTRGSSSSVSVPINTEGTMVMEPAVHGVDQVLARSSGHLVHGNYGGQVVRAVPNPWLDQQFCGSDAGAFLWNHGPYIQGPINVGGMEASNLGLHGYQMTTSNRNPSAFIHPPAVVPRQHPHNLHLPPPPPPMQGHNMELHSQLASTSRRLPTNTAIIPFQNGIEMGPRYVGPAPPAGLRVYRPHRREMMVEANVRHRGFPHLRVLPEDGVAILDISGYHEVRHSVDHHRDMRLDIDHMSYEELLALGERIGSVDSGLSDDFIVKRLKTRVFASIKSSSEPENTLSADQELYSCVICQNDYDDQEHIGVLDCGHEYHVECVKKWLIVKNTCPVCKSTALAEQTKES